MKALALIALLSSLIGQGDQRARPASSDKWLVIELPDGVRGGRGKIEGEAKWGADKRENYIAELLRAAQACRAVSPTFSTNWSHRAHLISWSSPKDLEVVACLKKTLPTHFNAGIAPASPDALLKVDQSPFRAFEAERPTTPSQAK